MSRISKSLATNGPLDEDVARDGEAIWSKEFLSGEDNMCHTIANLEQHHFKNRQFRR